MPWITIVAEKGSHKNLISPGESQFLTKNNTRITSQRGGLAILPCTVTMATPAIVSGSLG